MNLEIVEIDKDGKWLGGDIFGDNPDLPGGIWSIEVIKGTLRIVWRHDKTEEEMDKE